MAQPDEQAVKSLQLKHCIFLLSCLKNTTFSQYHILQTRVKYPFYVLFFEFEYKIQYNFENSLYFPDKLETFYNIQRFEHVNVPVYQCKYCRISIFFYISTCFTYSYIRAVQTYIYKLPPLRVAAITYNNYKSNSLNSSSWKAESSVDFSKSS